MHGTVKCNSLSVLVQQKIAKWNPRIPEHCSAFLHHFSTFGKDQAHIRGNWSFQKIKTVSMLNMLNGLPNEIYLKYHSGNIPVSVGLYWASTYMPILAGGSEITYTSYLHQSCENRCSQKSVKNLQLQHVHLTTYIAPRHHMVHGSMWEITFNISLHCKL